MVNYRTMKSMALVLLVVLVSTPLANIGYALGNESIEISNGFVKYSVNTANARFSISTVAGAAHRDDENQSLLFEEYIPDTSFTTFKIDGEEYIYGNDYGFMGIAGHFNEEPDNVGLSNKSVWTINGIEITQTLTLDEGEQNAGNVKISYKVKNTTNQDVQVGSRILLDTMLGLNDGSPISLPGSQTVIDKETELSGSEIPMYWKAIDQVYNTNVVSYGLISGWRNVNPLDEFHNTQPDRMIIGHWEGLSKTKWHYNIDSMLNFTSPNNAYGTRDSAVALYWNERVIGANSERVYETYYGLGEYATVESDTPVDMNLFSPERLYLNNNKDGYTKDTVTIGGEIDNALDGSQTLNNAKVRIDYSTGLSLPYGTSETINLGTVSAGNIKSFLWELNTSPIYSWTNFKYKVTLTADNLTEAVVRSGDILIPSISGEPPEIKFTDFRPRNLYSLDDEKVITITGQNLDAIAYGHNYRVIITDKETSLKHVVQKENLTLSRTSITVNIPKSLNLTTTGLYEVSVDYVEDGESKSHTLAGELTISNDPKYMIRKYGILLIVREEIGDTYNYNIQHAKNEKELGELEDNESIILDIRADEIIKAGDIYTITSETATINSIVTSSYDESVGHDPMTIEKRKDSSYMYDYVYITGKGKLSIPGFVFQDGPYEITFVDETFYSVTDEDDSEDVVINKPLIYEGAPVIDLLSITMMAFPISINNAILREKSITFGGSINLTSMLSAPSKISKKEKDPEGYIAKKVVSDDDDEEDDDGVEGSLNIDDLRFGIYQGAVMLEGLRADGSVGIPKNITKKIIPDCDLGAEIGVSVDTFDNWRFEVEADINFEVIQAKGNIVFKVFQLGGVPLPIPDTVIIYGGNKQPGIPLIPVAPVGFLTGLGGGFENLYDTVTLNFNVLPPLTLNAIASFQLFKILEANEVQLKVSARGITLEVAELGVGPLEIFENVGMHLAIKDDIEYPGFEIKTYAGLNVMDWVTGDAYYLCSIDMAVNNPNLGPVTIAGEASGSIQVPDEVFLVGGVSFGDAEIGISNQGIHSHMTLIGIPVSFEYNWGGRAAFRVFASLEQGIYPLDNRGIYYAYDYGENGEIVGALSVGENIHKVVNKSSKTLLASLSNEFYPMAAIDAKEHFFDITDHDYSLIEVDYNGDEPLIRLYDPNGQQVGLVEGQNYIVKQAPQDSVDEPNKIFVSIVNPANGEWKLTSSKNVTTNLYEVDAIPELTQVEGQLEDNGTDLTVTWGGNDITDESVNIVLCTDPDNDPGTMISQSLEASLGQASIPLPEDLTEGDYYIRAQLISQDDQAVLSTMESLATIHYLDMNKPSGVTNLAVSNIGNGLVRINWDDPQEELDGYRIDAIDELTDELVASYDVVENTGNNIIGGTYNHLASDSNGNTIEASSQSGMVPGREYRIQVSTYKTVNKIKHYSDQAIKVVTITEPNPADIQYEVSSLFGQIIDKGTVNEIQTYTTNQQDIQLSLGSSQQVAWEVSVNDEVVYDQTSVNPQVNIYLSSEETNVSIKAINGQGDVSQSGFTVQLDQEPPVLRIDSPQQGQLVNETITINGFVDLNSQLKINNEDVTYNDDGLFSYQLPMDDKMLEAVYVEAVDEVGNKAEYFAEVYNNRIEDIAEIKIRPSTNNLSVGDQVHYEVMLIDVDNNEFVVDDSLIEWSMLDNYGVLTADEEGNVRAQSAGKDVLIASYYITADYAFEDAVVIEVVSEVKDTHSIVVNPNSISLKRNESYTLEVYELFEDDSSRIIDNEVLHFQVVSGGQYLNISGTGQITAIRRGRAIVTVFYVKNGVTFEADVMINVTDSSSGGSGRLSEEDKIVINAYKSILNNDGSVQVLIHYFETIHSTETKKKIRAVLSSEDIEQAFSKALQDEQGRKKIILEFADEQGGIVSYQLDLPQDVLQTGDKREISIKTSLGSIVLPGNMIGDKYAGNDSNISIVIEAVDVEQLDNWMIDRVGDRPVITIRIFEDEGDDLSITKDNSNNNFAGSSIIKFKASNEANVEDLRIRVIRNGIEEHIAPQLVTDANRDTYYAISIDNFNTFIIYQPEVGNWMDNLLVIGDKAISLNNLFAGEGRSDADLKATVNWVNTTISEQGLSMSDLWWRSNGGVFYNLADDTLGEGILPLVQQFIENLRSASQGKENN